MKKNMIMKKGIIINFALLFAFAMNAQQIPVYSQYFFSRQLYNPAMCGFSNESQVYGFYRNQWTGMPGAPVTRGFTGETSLTKHKLGVGAHLINDNTDIIHRLDAQLYLAPKIKLGENDYLAAGVSAGLMDVSVDFTNANASDQYDPQMFNNKRHKVVFNTSIGLSYRHKNFSLGVSMPQLLNSEARFTSNLKETKFNLKRHIVAHTAWNIPINKGKFHIEPNVLFKMGGDKFQLDGALQADYKRMVYIGAGYRQDYGITANAAVRVAQRVTIGYAYDYSMMNGVAFADVKGSHEIMLGVQLSGKKSDDKMWKSINDTVNHKSRDLKVAIAKVNDRLDTIEQKNDEQDGQLENLDMRADSFDAFMKKIMGERYEENKGNLGDIIQLDRVYFDINKSTLLPSSQSQLNLLAALMKQQSTLELEIRGHTDYMASPEYNQKLSEARAKAVYEYLIAHGVSASRLKYNGYGETQPISDNKTEDGRQLNRRVEFKILKK